MACDLAIRRDQSTLDAAVLSSKLLDYLLTKDNFSVRYNAEISRIGKDPKTGKALNVSILGKMGSQIPCDILVISAGAQTARILYDNLGVYSPLAPMKSYA